MSKHTKGPWSWFCNGGSIDLRTPHSGQLLVMDIGTGTTVGKPKLRFSERSDNMGGLMKSAGAFVPEESLNFHGFTLLKNPDACLIAAAPELFDACNMAIQVIEQLIPEPSARGVADVVLAQLRAAIAKAGDTS